MSEIKKKKNTRERSKDTGVFVPKGTDKQFPKETSIGELDRPSSYQKREKPLPVDPIDSGATEIDTTDEFNR